MKVSPEMLKDYLLKELPEVSVSGNTRLRFRDVRLPEDEKRYEPEYIYLMNEEQWKEAGGRVNAIVPSCAADLQPDPRFCLVAAPVDPDLLLNRTRECFLTYSEWFEDLYKSIAIGDSIETILEKCTPVLANPFFIDDSSYRTLARLRNYPTNDFRDNEYIYMQQSGHHSADYIFAMLNSNVSVESSAISPRPIIHRLEFLAHRTLYSTIKVEGEIVGFFSCIEIETPFTPGMMDVCESLTELMNLVLSRQANMPATRQKSLDNDLFLGIMNGSIVDPELTKTAFAQVGLSQGDYFVVYTVTNVDTSENAFLLPRIMELLMSNLESGFTVADGSNIILVINAKLDDELREKLVHLIGFYLGEFDVTIGFSLGFSDPQLLPTYYCQAVAATRLGALTDNKSKVFGYGEVVGYDVLEKYGDRGQRLAICHPAIFTLLEHDTDKKMNLLPTLKVFVECLGDTAQAAERLYLHRNSLYYRLKQITALTGVDLADERVRSHITLSIRILEINGDLKR
ncbi:MAG: helix-turn-helix domain-containing protein [Clostridiales bacterium]|nr:helix-turn-helix domain-containing protein [Clostridiales bacterium]